MSIVALNDVSFTTTSKQPYPTAKIVFIGNQSSFSGSLIAATRQELGPITSTALDSFKDFRRLIETAAYAPAIAMLDEPTLRDMAAEQREFLLGLPDLSIGLAYSSTAFAKACYHDATLRPRLLSIVPLDVRLDIWLSIVKLVAQGGSYVCPEVLAGVPADADADDNCGLTQRQLDVLRLVADGHSNKCIAAMLGLSIHTVKLHLHNANLRLGVRNRTEAAMRYRALRP